MRTVRAVLLCLSLLAGAAAHAQRTLVPIVDFENIPVTVATDARVSAEQVRQAFVDAADEAHWRLVPAGDGVLEGTYVKGNKHTIVVTIRYDAEKYSVAFKSSDNMNQRASQYPTMLTKNFGADSMQDQAVRKQRALFADRPESAYIKPHPEAVIHPFYEHWVQELLQRVRLKLKRAAP